MIMSEMAPRYRRALSGDRLPGTIEGAKITLMKACLALLAFTLWTSVGWAGNATPGGAGSTGVSFTGTYPWLVIRCRTKDETSESAIDGLLSEDVHLNRQRYDEHGRLVA